MTDYLFRKPFDATTKVYPIKALVHKQGKISFSEGADFKYHLGRWEGALLFYDKDNHAIGVQKSQKVDPSAFKVINGQRPSISCRQFFLANEIELETGLWVTIEEIKDGMLVLPLKKGKQTRKPK